MSQMHVIRTFLEPVGGTRAGNVNHNDHQCINLLSILLCLGKLLLSSGILIQVTAAIIIITSLLENV